MWSSSFETTLYRSRGLRNLYFRHHEDQRGDARCGPYDSLGGGKWLTAIFLDAVSLTAPGFQKDSTSGRAVITLANREAVSLRLPRTETRASARSRYSFR